MWLSISNSTNITYHHFVVEEHKGECVDRSQENIRSNTLKHVIPGTYQKLECYGACENLDLEIHGCEHNQDRDLNQCIYYTIPVYAKSGVQNSKHTCWSFHYRCNNFIYLQLLR